MSFVSCSCFLLSLASIRDVFLSAQPYMVVFNAALGLVIGSMTLYLLIRTRPRKSEFPGVQPGCVVVNWTGHPLPEAPWLVACKVWQPDAAPTFNVESWDTIRQSVSRLLYDMPRDLQLRLLHGDPNLVIAIPQLGAGLSILLATLHGQSGVFPSITSPLRHASGSFWLPEPVSLSDIRLQSREQREWS